MDGKIGEGERLGRAVNIYYRILKFEILFLNHEIYHFKRDGRELHGRRV